MCPIDEACSPHRKHRGRTYARLDAVFFLPARLRPATRSAATRTAARRHLRARFVHREATASELIGVQLVDGLLGIRVRSHLDEAETAGAPGYHVPHDGDLFNGTCAREQLLQLRFTRFVREIPNIQLATHNTDSSAA